MSALSPLAWLRRLPRLFGERASGGGMPTFSTIAWLAAGMGFATLPFLGRVPWWLLTVVIGLGLWRLRLAWYGRPAPGKGTRHVISLGVLATLWATGNIGLGLDAAAPLFVAFLWIKLLELDAERDVLMASFLGFFLVTGVLLTGQSLVLTLQAFSAAVVLLAGNLWYHSPNLGGATMVDGSVASVAAKPPPAARRLEFPVRESAKVMGKTLMLLAQALPFALLLFLFTPRPVIQLSINSRNATAGISDHLDPGKFASNTKNEQIAFRVEFPNHDMPEIDDLYWRGLVLWQTDGNAWQRGPQAAPSYPGWVTRVLPDTTASGKLADPTATRAPAYAIQQDITQPASPNAWLYALDTPVAQIDETMLLPGLISEWRDGPPGTATYRATSNPLLRPADWSSLARRFALQLPRDIDPRIRALGQQFARAPSTIAQTIDRAIEWFTANKFVYSLEPGEMGSNATATFLFEKRTGFCAHYASAFCTVMRAAGVPARVVVGYRGGEINPQGGFLTVRQSHAHAWAEVWTGHRDTGWRRVDLTSVIPASDPATGQATTATAAQATSATARAAQRAKRPWYEQALFRIRTTYEYVESRWDRWAVGYNTDLQDALLSWLGLDDFGGWAHGVGLIVGGMIVVVSIVLTTWLTPLVRAHLALSREEHAYRRLLATCAKAGIPRNPSEGPRDHLQRVAAKFPSAAAALDAAANGWLTLRYAQAAGDRRKIRADLAAARRAVRSLAT